MIELVGFSGDADTSVDPIKRIIRIGDDMELHYHDRLDVIIKGHRLASYLIGQVPLVLFGKVPRISLDPDYMMGKTTIAPLMGTINHTLGKTDYLITVELLYSEGNTRAAYAVHMERKPPSIRGLAHILVEPE